ncbi:MAG: sigma-70 family RNA polymerase sigma factor [Chloroflexaceae bacterium]|nr:sigma-70 family RNA polymerase sigma factor [Chloroflexaceae bacterium]
MFWPFRSRVVAQPETRSSPPLEEPGDSALIRRARQRDGEAFGILYERYLERVYRYIAYRTANTVVAEDLTSEVFLNAWKSIERYEDRGYAFSTWLLRLAHNEVTDYYRTRRNDTSLPETDVHVSHLPGPDDFAELKDDQVALLRAVRQLPDEWRQVILLRFVEGLPFDEIAVIVGKSSGACRVIQHRALARLRELLPREEKVREVSSIAQS